MMMKTYLMPLLLVLFFSCSKTEDNTATVQLEFKHQWKDQNITNAFAENTVFEVSPSQALAITRLRYLISDIELIASEGKAYKLWDYHLVDWSKEGTFSLQTAQQLPIGNYSKLRFRFGFSASKNTDGAYKDLNAASWNVPAMLGGGYHYLQLDGKYGPPNGSITNPFNFHMIPAADLSGDELVVEDTSFEVDFGAVTLTVSGTFTIIMDVSKWFNSPVIWDLEQWNTTLMPNFEAQKVMHQNGKNVFQLQ